MGRQARLTENNREEGARWKIGGKGIARCLTIDSEAGSRRRAARCLAARRADQKSRRLFVQRGGGRQSSTVPEDVAQRRVTRGGRAPRFQNVGRICYGLNKRQRDRESSIESRE